MTNIPVLQSMLYRLHFSKSFQSDNHVYCDLNIFLSSFIEIAFKLEIVLVVIVQLLYDVMHQADY